MTDRYPGKHRNESGAGKHRAGRHRKPPEQREHRPHNLGTKLAKRLAAVAAASVVLGGFAPKGEPTPAPDHHKILALPDAKTDRYASTLREEAASAYSHYQLVELQNGRWQHDNKIGNVFLTLQASTENAGATTEAARQNGLITSVPAVTLREIVEKDGQPYPGPPVSRTVVARESDGELAALLSVPEDGGQGPPWALFVEYAEQDEGTSNYRIVYCGSVQAREGRVVPIEPTPAMSPSFVIGPPQQQPPV